MEQMTRERLAAYRSNKEEILELDYVLNNRWRSDTMIGNDVIFDYRKGYPMPQSVTGFDRDKYERLQDRDLRRMEKLKQENEEIEKFVDNIQDGVTHRIFRIYFIDGRRSISQNKVAKKIHIDRSRVSRKIDSYLKNAQKAQKAHL